jgi:Tol biopolymer transport system component
VLQLLNNATLRNAGTLTWTGTAAGSLQQSGGVNSVTNAGTFVAGGTGTLAVGVPFANTGVLDVQLGTLDVNSTFTHGVGALLRGTGTLDLTNAAVTFNGNVDPAGPGAVGTLAITGGLALSPTSIFAADVAPGPTGDRLALTGAFTRNGTLVVSPTGGYTPTGGDQFIPVSAGSPPTGSWTDPLDWTSAVVGNTIVTTYAPPQPQILFAADSAGSAVNSGIFRVNGDGTNQTHITSDGPPGELNVHPRWSPDRSRITYTHRTLRTGPNQVYVRSADGQQAAVVVTDTSGARPRYSPDGKHLAFECGNGNYPVSAQDVCVIPDITNPVTGMGDGSGKVFVTDAADPELGGSGAFAWNPQNPNQLAVARDSVFQGPTVILGSVIWVVNFDGSGATPLGTKVIQDGAGNPVSVTAMDWSPDGTFIVFEGVSGASRSIFRIDVATPIVTQLTSQSQDYRPVISPDNTQVLFGRAIDIWVLMKVPATVGGSGPEQITTNMNFGLDQAGWDWSPDGSEIVLTEDLTTDGVVISKILRSTTVTSYFSDVTAGRVGRRGGAEIQDRQPSWRP